MVIDRTTLVEYPYNGAFYKVGIDESLPPSQQVEDEILVMEVKCDIQEAQKTDSNGYIVSSFNVYFPFDTKEDLPINKGMIFKGSKYGLKVEGEIIGLDPTQMGGCAVYLKNREV